MRFLLRSILEIKTTLWCHLKTQYVKVQPTGHAIRNEKRWCTWSYMIHCCNIEKPVCNFLIISQWGLIRYLWSLTNIAEEHWAPEYRKGCDTRRSAQITLDTLQYCKRARNVSLRPTDLHSDLHSRMLPYTIVGSLHLSLCDQRLTGNYYSSYMWLIDISRKKYFIQRWRHKSVRWSRLHWEARNVSSTMSYNKVMAIITRRYCTEKNF